MKLINPKEVPENSKIIDILSDSSFAEEHVKGAQNICIYELAFAEKIKEAHPIDTPLFIYGYGGDTGESKKAHSTLIDLGYKDVQIINGGLKAWKDSGLPVESLKTKELNGDFNFSKETKIEWVARNIGNKHVGSIKIKEGNITIKDGEPAGGKLIIDMTTIGNYDVDKEYKQHLLNHLKSSDFFEVDSYPEAIIEFNSAEKIKDVASKPNYKIKADLTIKGIKKPIEFLAQVHKKEGKPVINAHLDIDRSRWNVMYGSEKFFAKLGIHIIDDMITFDIIAM